MEHEPNLTRYVLSKQIIEDGISYQIDICKLEDADHWSLEVAIKDGTSILWDERFDDDKAALEEAVKTIRREGARAFRYHVSKIIPFRR